MSTIPAIVNEARTDEFKKLYEKKDEKHRKGSIIAFRESTEFEFGKVINFQGDILDVQTISAEFDENLLAYRVIEYMGERSIQSRCVISKGNSCRIDEQKYVLFFDIFE